MFTNVLVHETRYAPFELGKHSSQVYKIVGGPPKCCDPICITSGSITVLFKRGNDCSICFLLCDNLTLLSMYSQTHVIVSSAEVSLPPLSTYAANNIA